MTNLDPFRSEALRRGIPPDEIERWIRTARPCATLGPGGDGPVVGQLGGHPLLPADAPDPSFPFAASLDCAAIPAGATDLPLPASGTLLLFASPDGLISGYPAACQVLHVPAGTPVAQRPAPPVGEDDSEVPPPASLRLAIDLSLPNEAESTPEHPHGEELASVWWNLGTDLLSDGPLQVGGYPWIWNYEPVESVVRELGSKASPGAPVPDIKDWVMLAEWSVDSEVFDHGLVHWVIRHDDLAAGRFDRVRASADMV
jgi:hypothetical protein